jgi:CBS-domain-containing membrane protein
MNFLGVLHPPAGAAALIFATAPPALEEIKFMYLVFPLLVGNIISVLMATLINNLNKKREYPLYWTMTGPLAS